MGGHESVKGIAGIFLLLDFCICQFLKKNKIIVSFLANIYKKSRIFAEISQISKLKYDSRILRDELHVNKG
jgi:hypothetical protein